ncbi:hypothetical protein FISHEDRAFT_47647 [Fistulina hepatica ATCC 64428]|uniref:Core-binding (CB) domain-containing protein n=1 Tax=Fistulina hepatica ATCC 64428 TaxID=1128425 RepID=A0A0D7A5E0_9AGAR|nr:hypothetical protein FISHEDRAFT_47647 [Fistulina hepatica ATCC 64428]
MNFDNPHARQLPRAPWSRERLQTERAIAIGASIDVSSRAAYSSALQSYVSFCRMHQLPIEPTADTLSFFVVYMSHHIKPSSVNSYLSGICAQLQPFFPNVRVARSDQLVRRTLTGCLKLFSSPTRRKRPLHRQELIHLAENFHNAPSLDRALWWAQLLVGFYGLLRLGELVVPNQAHLHDCRKVIRRLLVTFHHTAFSFILPANKADRCFNGNKVIIQSTTAADDPSIGRWSSEAFKVYIHTHPVILASILHSRSH